MKNNIYLIGFMGSGKTTIGRHLAEKIPYTWIDLDEYIEHSQNMSIKALFEEYGEPYFRNLETQGLSTLSKENNFIVSTGGGVIVTPQNVMLLKKQKTFYLKWDFDTLFHRVAHDANRPLVKSYDQLFRLYQSRAALYENACEIVIMGEGKSIAQITNEILNVMEA